MMRMRATRTFTHLRLSGSLLIALALATPCLAGTRTDDALCTTRFSNEIRNLTATGDTFIAVSPFVLACRGHIHAEFRVPDTRLSMARLQLEHYTAGHWTAVASGWHIDYRAEPGKWRITVIHSGKPGATFNGTLRYSIPRR